MSKWDAFNNSINFDEISEFETSNGEKDYDDIPAGKYEACLNNLVLKVSKTGKPMMSFTFEIIAGDYDGRKVFYSQLLDEPWKFGKANSLLLALYPDAEPLKYSSFDELETLLDKILTEVGDEWEYEISYTVNKNGFGSVSVDKIFTDDEDDDEE